MKDSVAHEQRDRPLRTIAAGALPLQADTKPPATGIQRSYAPPSAPPRRANRKSRRAISREEAATYLGVGYSTFEKMAARGEGPFCFRVGSVSQRHPGKHPAKAAGGLGRVAVGRCGQAACWAVWLSRVAFQFQGSRAWIWCTG
jgi:excisionase family DNA binding protein